MPFATDEIIADAFEANMTALRAGQPTIHAALQSADPPFPLRVCTARDGAATFQWTDGDGVVRWLGRSTMPAIRAEALLQQFRPGTGNLLLHHFGHGALARRLLDCIAPHQAVFVIEPDAWMLRASLRLHDFTSDIRRRRLLLFAGPGAWRECGDFLAEHRGFVAPTRVLHWPWFDRETVAHIAMQLTSLQADVARRRAETKALGKRPRLNGPKPVASIARVAVLSNNVDPSSLRLCRRLEAGARSAGLETIRLAPESPDCAASAGVEEALIAFEPSHVLLVDAQPESFGFVLPSSRQVMICSRLAAAMDGDVSGMTFIALSRSVERGLIERGVRPERIHRIMPAAPMEVVEPSRGAGVLALADRHDHSAESAGLHLTSHVRLWNMVSELLRAGPPDDMAARVDKSFESAQQRLGIRIDSEEVRVGLTERIQTRLVPELFRRAACAALSKVGVSFHVLGRGWGHAPFEPVEYNPRMTTAHEGRVADLPPRREAPLPGDELSAALRDFGAVVFLEAGEDLPGNVMDCMAGGRVVFVPTASTEVWREDAFDTMDPIRHVIAFDSIATLTDAVAGFVREPGKHLTRASEAAGHFCRHHTWSHRIGEILKFLDAVTEAAP